MTEIPTSPQELAALAIQDVFKSVIGDYLVEEAGSELPNTLARIYEEMETNKDASYPFQQYARHHRELVTIIGSAWQKVDPQYLKSERCNTEVKGMAYSLLLN